MFMTMTHMSFLTLSTHISTTMHSIRTIQGDLFYSTEIEGFAGNINTATVKGHGFTHDAPSKLGSWADPYSHRTAMISSYGNALNLCIPEQRYTPGTIVVQECPVEVKSNIRYALWLVTQVDMSLPRRYKRFQSVYEDTFENRERWFAAALDEAGKWCEIWSVANDNRKFRLAMSNRTGCGYAGGALKRYQQMMRDFAERYKHAVELIWFQYSE
jgi:hypothetical protein